MYYVRNNIKVFGSHFLTVSSTAVESKIKNSIRHSKYTSFVLYQCRKLNCWFFLLAFVTYALTPYFLCYFHSSIFFEPLLTTITSTYLYVFSILNVLSCFFINYSDMITSSLVLSLIIYFFPEIFALLVIEWK